MAVAEVCAFVIAFLVLYDVSWKQGHRAGGTVLLVSFQHVLETMWEAATAERCASLHFVITLPPDRIVPHTSVFRKHLKDELGRSVAEMLCLPALCNAGRHDFLLQPLISSAAMYLLKTGAWGGFILSQKLCNTPGRFLWHPSWEPLF